MYVCVCRSVCACMKRVSDFEEAREWKEVGREKAVRHVCIYNLFGEAR